MKNLMEGFVRLYVVEERVGELEDSLEEMNQLNEIWRNKKNIFF